MNVLMFTNTFTPHVGGVARSVQSFAGELRARGHRVVVVAPEFEGADPNERDVVRFPALQRYSGTDFSIPLPVPGIVHRLLDRFEPTVIHSHHPFMLGDMALRVAASRRLPVVFTHHTMFEEYTHYVPGDSPRLRRFAIDLVTGYCDLADAVIAPSESVARVLDQRGIVTPVEVIPTGVDLELFGGGDRTLYRQTHGIPGDAFVVGHVGRLAPEKNPEFLAAAIGRFLQGDERACSLIVGSGPSRNAIEATLEECGVMDRVRFAGLLERNELADAYAAMDVFAFVSQSETQGLVLAEAMAAGVPVVAVDASGAREVVRDGYNGRLLAEEDLEQFVEALQSIADGDEAARQLRREAALATAAEFSIASVTGRLVNLYQRVSRASSELKSIDDSLWQQARRMFAEELRIAGNIAGAAAAAFGGKRKGDGSSGAGPGKKGVDIL
jgi:1,2-diacylglycerol 3-alpha-glucosyltransferase